MTDRELIRIARDELTADEISVWMAKYVSGLGRRTGSLALGISEDAWRWRIRRAEAKVLAKLKERAAA